MFSGFSKDTEVYPSWESPQGNSIKTGGERPQSDDGPSLWALKFPLVLFVRGRFFPDYKQKAG